MLTVLHAGWYPPEYNKRTKRINLQGVYMINLLWSVFFVMLLSGCGWNGTPTRSGTDFIPLTSIEITADYSTIARGTSAKLTVKGNHAGLITGDIINPDQVTWVTSQPGVADFKTSGIPNRVSGLTPGTTILTATVGSVKSTYTLAVSSATVTAVTVTPVAPSVPNGLTQQFAATGTFSDGTTQILTDDVTWASSLLGVATISDTYGSKGLAQTQTVSVTPTKISATFGIVSGTADMTVTPAALKSIAITPASPSILTLSAGKLTAVGTYTDNTTSDITSQVTWSSSDTSVATISGGTATVLKSGSTTIGASLGTVSQSTSLKATGGNLTGITITPATQTLVKKDAVATTGRISATGTFSNGSSRDITGAVTWTAADTSLATAAVASGTLAWVTAVAVTPKAVPTKVTAASGSLSATATVAVTAPLLQSIAFSTTALNPTIGTSAPIAVNATFDDGTTQDVTPFSTWTSNDLTKATGAAGGLGSERVTGVGAGTTTLSATYGGKTVLAPATITVTSRNLLSLTLSPGNVSIGNKALFPVTANYSDVTVDVTNEPTASWSIDTPNVAVLADSVNQPGQVVGVDTGTAMLTVTFGGKSQTAKITVTGP